MKHIFFFILTTLALFGCTGKEKAPTRNLLFYIRYDAAEKSVRAEAKFQDDVKKIAIEMPGGFLYQGVEMELAPVYGMTYRYEHSADYIAEHEFRWRDRDQAQQSFKMGIDPITAFSFSTPEISRSKPIALDWQGPALAKGETLVFIWENAEKGVTIPMEVTTTSATPHIDFPAAKIGDLSAGQWSVYLVRKRLVKGTSGNLPVNGILEYYTKPLGVKIVE